jgi:uncharacterized protein YjbI with pentapeptide repeats
MKFRVFTLTLTTVLGIATPAWAENLVHTQQLVNTRACPQCDLSEGGFVLTDLSGVDLSGANLTRANFNRANLRNANLRGANLVGAVMFSADLSGADLSGADLRGADLREANLTGVNLEGAIFEGANLLGAIGLPSQIATPEQLYLWGLAETQRGNFRGAISYYNQALRLKPDFAHAILARGVARFQINDPNGAIQDGQQAEQLYITQGNEQGFQTAVRFYEGVEAIQEGREDAARRAANGGGSNFMNFLGSLTSLFLRMML